MKSLDVIFVQAFYFTEFFFKTILRLLEFFSYTKIFIRIEM